MSDANAVAVLASLVSWYPLTSDLTDAHGSNDLVTGASASYEAGGKVGGNRLAAGAIGACTLASPIPITSTSAKLWVGGWIYYTGSTPANAEFGLSLDYNLHNEQLTIQSASGFMEVFGWEAGGATFYNAVDPNVAGLAYNFTVRVEDSLAQVATSPQQIIIRDAGDPLAEGWYFVVGQWNEGICTLYVNGNLVDTGTAAASVRGSPISHFQIGNQFNGAVSQGALSQIFFGSGAVLTQAQIDYLYNSGAGKSYANVTSDAA